MVVGLTGGPSSERRRDQACRRASPANELVNSPEECGGVAAIFGDGRVSRFLRDTDLQQEAFLTVQDGTMSRKRVVVVQYGTPQLRRGNRVRLGSHGGLFVVGKLRARCRRPMSSGRNCCENACLRSVGGDMGAP